MIKTILALVAVIPVVAFAQPQVPQHEHRSHVERHIGGNRIRDIDVNRNTRINVTQFRERHRDVFTLGRHPRDFFISRFGVNHVRLIGSSYFVYTDGCWVAVDVDGFAYVERVICPGDPEFIEVN